MPKFLCCYCHCCCCGSLQRKCHNHQAVDRLAVHVSQCCDRPLCISSGDAGYLRLWCRGACALYMSSVVTDIRELGSVASRSAMWLCTQPPCPSSWSIEADSSASSWSSLQVYETVQQVSQPVARIRNVSCGSFSITNRRHPFQFDFSK